MNNFGPPSGDPFFRIFITVFILIAALIVAAILTTIVRGMKQWSANNGMPVLTVDAWITSKRTNVSHSHHHSNGNDAFHSSTDTSYYATFQVESGDRMEFQVDGREYGLLAEGDRGRLTFQGTRYKGFSRSV